MTVFFLYRATTSAAYFGTGKLLLEYKSWLAMIIVHETGLRSTNNG